MRGWSVDLPGGAIRSEAGDIRLRTKGQAYTGAEFEEIVLLTRPDGTRVTLGDIATIRDGFAEVESFAFFNGEPSFGINVMSTKQESEIEISEAVNRFAEQRRATLPEGVELTAWADGTFYLKGRLNMMLENMAMGAVLVFAILGIFLHMKIATWVIIGLPVGLSRRVHDAARPARGRVDQHHEPVRVHPGARHRGGRRHHRRRERLYLYRGAGLHAGQRRGRRPPGGRAPPPSGC